MTKRLSEAFPTVVRYSGLFLVFFLVGFWALTNRLNGELFAFIGLMMGLTEGVSAIRDLNKEDLPPAPPAPPPPVPTTTTLPTRSQVLLPGDTDS